MKVQSFSVFATPTLESSLCSDILALFESSRKQSGLLASPSQHFASLHLCRREDSVALREKHSRSAPCFSAVATPTLESSLCSDILALFESSRKQSGLLASPSPHFASLHLCRREDSNLHGLLHLVLSQARLPISPLRHFLHIIHSLKIYTSANMIYYAHIQYSSFHLL